jgi:hypothetical protein
VSRHDNSFLLSWRVAGNALFLFSPTWTAIDSYNEYDSSIHSTHRRMYEAHDLFTGRYELGNALRITDGCSFSKPSRNFVHQIGEFYAYFRARNAEE